MVLVQIIINIHSFNSCEIQVLLKLPIEGIILGSTIVKECKQRLESPARQVFGPTHAKCLANLHASYRLFHFKCDPQWSYYRAGNYTVNRTLS